MLRQPILFSIALVAGLLAGVSMPASALAPAAGKTVLSVTGLVGEKNTDTAAVFDMAMLEKLPQQTFTTHTPWDKQPVTFTGPLLRDVLAAVKASGTQLKAMALNDYQTTIPMEDAQRFDVIVAYKLNGQAIPVKTKGPLFIVYPFDSKTELQTTRYYERSAWQLKSIKIE
ncbi:molybdopterin-dependent oxidoreductase [Rhodoferax sp. WC2427]|uniref:molybdopterin-dependent oxidoreductase n=1 Tax=Rhodoferax sp. WC2427 TaxID=3234144 RepID=UPI0034666D57